MKIKIKQYFSGLKSPYSSASNPVWRFLRNREKSCFYDLIQNLNKTNCLDLGAGSCEYSSILLRKGARHSVCVDFSASLMSSANDPRIEKIIADVEEFIPNQLKPPCVPPLSRTKKWDKRNLTNKTKYDLILCLGILEFLHKPENLMIHLKSLLKPQGKIIILLPHSKIGCLGYVCWYLLKGISIHFLTLKKMNRFLTQNGFFLEKTASPNFFSGFAVYSVKTAPEQNDK